MLGVIVLEKLEYHRFEDNCSGKSAGAIFYIVGHKQTDSISHTNGSALNTDVSFHNLSLKQIYPEMLKKKHES